MDALLRPRLGFSTARNAVMEAPERTNSQLSRAGVEAARRRFPPEFLNRLDAVVAFNPLGAEELRQILELELEAVQKRIAAANQAAMSLTVSEAARKHILEEGTDARYGARHLRRAVERRLVFPIANLMATGQVQDGDRIVVELDPELGKLVFLKEFEDNRPEIAISAKTAA